MDRDTHSAVCVTCIVGAARPGWAAAAGPPLPTAPGCPAAGGVLVTAAG